MPNMLEELNEEMNTWNSKGALAAANTVFTIYPDGLSVCEKAVNEDLLYTTF